MESALFPVPANESTCLYQRRASHGAMGLAPWPQNAVVSGGGFIHSTFVNFVSAGGGYAASLGMRGSQ